MSGAKKVFCIGLGKTGTKTIADVLERSGRKHSTGPVNEGLFWYRSDQIQKIKRVTEAFDSFDDYPYPLIYRYLTTRSSPDEWADSVIDHHMRFGPSDAQLMTFGFYPLSRDRKWLCEFYERHYQEVTSYFKTKDNFFIVDWADSESANTFLRGIYLDPDTHRISPKNTKGDQDAERVIIKHMANKRPGAALVYAQDQPARQPLMNKITQYGDRPLRSKILKALYSWRTRYL
jgi:hypothetical protein